ncbi:MAG: transporter ATP-binding protein [Chlamydiales bacterium]|nr:transporter ATP-binding protein [Chlamydiales bacterium]
MPALELTRLKKTYGQLTAVNDFSLNIEEGEIFALLGPNGAGKSSIISMIAGLETITEGSITVCGLDSILNRQEIKRLIGIVPQEIISHGFFTAWEVLKFHSGYYGISDNLNWTEFLLKKLNLWEHRNKKVGEMSGGMKRRLLIAKALVHKPKLLILDEPTAGVDIQLRAALWQFIKELNSEGMTILLTTHYIEEAERLCHRVGIINRGMLQKVDHTSSLIANLTYRQFIFTFKEIPTMFSHPWLFSQNNYEVVFRVPSLIDLDALCKEIRLDITQIRDLKIQEGNLEEALMSILGENNV